MSTAITLPLALLARMRDTAAQVGTIVEVHALDTPEDEARAGHLLRAIKTLHAEGEDARKALKAPHLAAGRAVDDAFAEPRRHLERVEAMIKRRLSEAAQKREAARQLAIENAREAAAAGDHEAVNAGLEAIDIAGLDRTPAGISTRWTYEVESVDLAALPLEYRAVNMEKVRAEIATANREGRPPAVGGIVFRKVAGIAARRLA